MRFDFIGPSYQDDTRDIDYQRTVNMYLHTHPGGGVSTVALVRSPGLSQMVNISSSLGRVRGIIDHDSRLFCVADDKFYELTYTASTDSISATLRGTLTTTETEDPVSMAGNPTQIMIVDGTTAGHTFNLNTNTLSTIGDVDFLGGDTVVFVDTFFIYNARGTAQMYASSANDGTAWNAADVATAEGDADKLVALLNVKNELWAIGQKTTEIWFNAANASGFPFSRRSDILFFNGCSAAHSAVAYPDGALWLDHRGKIIQSVGYELATVSTIPLEKEIQGYSTISDAKAYYYEEDGHSFYVITFPTEGKTWVYDLVTKAWHERSHRNTTTNVEERHLSNCYALHQNKHFVGAHSSGRIYRMSREFYDDAGDPIRIERISRHGNIENSFITIYKLELLVDTGQALQTGEGSDPHLRLQYSTDGGYTWSPELWQSVGTVGQYQERVRWYGLGTSNNWTWRLQYTSPTKLTIMDAFVDMETSWVSRPASQQ